MNRIVARKEIGVTKSISQQQIFPVSWRWWDGKLWLHWVLANTIGEILGLGLAGVVGAGMVLAIGEPKTALIAVIMAVAMIVVGTCEGVIVGFAQWSVLRHRLHQMKWSEWVWATAIGALVAWAMGMAPSTLMAMNQDAGSSPPPEVSDMLKYALAALMGAALGVVLGIPQCRVLRRYVSRAWLWVWANAAAWFFGMPLVFIGAGSSPSGVPVWRIALAGIATIAVAGAVVGAIHGVALLWLLDQRGMRHDLTA